MKYIFLSFAAYCLLSCNHIETEASLSEQDIQRIQDLGLLDKGEKIHQFYSEYKNQSGGNFFTDKRIAKYWIDTRDKGKDQKSTAFYADIRLIDTFYNVGTTNSPYILVTRLDNTHFTVSASGERADVKAFFEGAIGQWRKHMKAAMKGKVVILYSDSSQLNIKAALPEEWTDSTRYLDEDLFEVVVRMEDKSAGIKLSVFDIPEHKEKDYQLADALKWQIRSERAAHKGLDFYAEGQRTTFSDQPIGFFDFYFLDTQGLVNYCRKVVFTKGGKIGVLSIFSRQRRGSIFNLADDIERSLEY